MHTTRVYLADQLVSARSKSMSQSSQRYMFVATGVKVSVCNEDIHKGACLVLDLFWLDDIVQF